MRRDSNIAVSRFTGRIQRHFVPRFYHDRRNSNFRRGLTFVGEKKEIDEVGFFDSKFGRKLYEHSRKGDQNTRNIHPKDLDWLFPDKYYSYIGFTVHGFSFTFKNASNKLRAILNPSTDLINTESNLEEVENTLTGEIFFPVKKYIKWKNRRIHCNPNKNFINESYFLYNKSNLIKKTFITAINKQVSLYGSFSYFSEKTSISNLKLLTSNDFLTFFVEKKSLKSNLRLQFTIFQ